MDGENEQMRRGTVSNDSGDFSIGKFQDPNTTEDGKERASIELTHLETLWVNTGTLCNIECVGCYIESSPTNDRLSYITTEELFPFLEEAKQLGTSEIAFTGGEPFMNPDMIAMTRTALENQFSVLILTNAMQPMMRPSINAGLIELRKRFQASLKLRVSVDHYTSELHDKERSAGAFASLLEGLKWLRDNDFSFTIAGRILTEESEVNIRDGFRALFSDQNIKLDAHNPAELIIFPEMDMTQEVPEITTECWGILGKNPNDVMCATSRMLVKRKEAKKPAVLSCTLLPYEKAFELGGSLREAAKPVKLNHSFCAQFCVLGGASCSG